ncbi:hypothetical protein HanHA300_Chr03g0074761 [Helianthus annuus]|nr:hypothetical protein HanHA300_Chr03g0074761 [Helianthus annuus]KAJ0606459.1 hypothetical protein HanHA89_Chr03g0085361 [Helianthus annuus]KAJ0766549.1 hypothetical protein HanLR1_Chr03g0078871 [Helianthus annuus]
MTEVPLNKTNLRPFIPSSHNPFTYREPPTLTAFENRRPEEIRQPEPATRRAPAAYHLVQNPRRNRRQPGINHH